MEHPETGDDVTGLASVLDKQTKRKEAKTLRKALKEKQIPAGLINGPQSGKGPQEAQLLGQSTKSFGLGRLALRWRRPSKDSKGKAVARPEPRAEAGFNYFASRMEY